MKFTTCFALFAFTVFSASNLPSQSSSPKDTKATGIVKWENGVGMVESKAATITLGESRSTNYIVSAEVRLATVGTPFSVVVFPEEPWDGSMGGFYRVNFARHKEGLSMLARPAEWNAATKRWDQPKLNIASLEFKPNADEKGIKPILNDIQRDGVKTVPYHERWLRVRIDVSATNADMWLDGLLLRRIPLTDRRAGPVTLMLSKGDQIRNAKFESATNEGTFLPIELGQIINNGVDATHTESSIEHGGVPFHVLDDGKTGLDLHKAAWPDAQRDPSTYNEVYDDGPLFLHDPRTPSLRVPVEDYSAIHVLAIADDDPNTIAGFTVRAGHLDTRKQCVLYDFPASVPRRNAISKEDAARVVKVGNAKFVHIRVPLSLAFSQDIFQWIDLQLTKEIRLARRRPDPSRFRFRPLGLPSGVQIVAVTLERSPIQIRVTSKETGHAFVEPTKPEFTVTLRNVSAKKHEFELQAIANHLDGTETKANSRGKVEAGKSQEVKLAIPVTKHGYHDISIALLVDGKPLLMRYTSFAVLPPDTRTHRAESPFGTWDFSGGHFTCPDPDIVGSLYKKAGLRLGMFGFTAEERKRWGVQAGNAPKSIKSAGQYTAWREKSPDALSEAMLLHENSVSGGHVTRVPDIFHDHPPYKLSEDEQKRFQGLWDAAESMGKIMKTNFPNVRLLLGNGPLPTKEILLKEKFPADLFDALGNEAGSFGRQPEAQPPDYVANNASLWMDHELLKAYGYDKPVEQCYEVCYPNTNPGNLTPETQAAYFVRHAMHSLAWGVPYFRFGCISDMGSSYRYSNWGSTGITRSWPEVNVKPSFVAVATMTRVLDGAKFSRALDLGSLSLYGVEFKRADGKRVYVFWTMRGSRTVKFPVSGGSWSLTDDQGNDTQPTAKDGKLEVTLTPTPVYLIGEGELKTAEPASPTYTESPRGKVSELAAFDSLTGWKVDADHNYILEYHNFMTPRRKGDFKFETLPEFESEKGVIRVAPQSIEGGKATMPMYAVLRHDKGIAIPGEPTEIGVWVNGNSSWGRIIFELQDAKGQAWISIGASARGELSPWLLDWMPKEALETTKKSTQADWNTDDVYGLSRIDFDGWRYVGVPLPGNYPGEHNPWPASSQWKYDGDGIVHYPLTVKAIIVELTEKTLHLTIFAPAPRKEVYLKRLVAAQDDSSTVKQSISEWARP